MLPNLTKQPSQSRPLDELSPAEKFSLLPKKEQEAYLNDFDDDELRMLQYEFESWWARPKQVMPKIDGTWDVWAIIAGRGWGKNRTASEAVKTLVMDYGYKRIGLIARTAADVRDVMVEGESGILSVFPPWFEPVYEPSKRRITFPNGAICTTYSGDKPDQLRGPQHDAIVCDELAAWRYPETWDMALMGLRLGDEPIAIVTTTPRPTKIIKSFLKDPRTRLTKGSTYENQANLPEKVMRKFKKDYEGTTLGRQELYAEVLEDVKGALFKQELIDRHRKSWQDVVSVELSRVVVGVDPSTTEDGANTGIVVVAMDKMGNGWVLADLSMQGTPAKWGEAVVNAYHEFMADLVVGEANNGGDMIESVINTAALNAEMAMPNYEKVYATRGKALRAEPISALYEQGRVHHAGVLSELETQMITWVPGEKSPDRLDALVWGLTELFVVSSAPTYRKVRAKWWN